MMIANSIVIPALRRDPSSDTRDAAKWAPAQGRGDGWGLRPRVLRTFATVVLLFSASAAQAQEDIDVKMAERYFDQLDQKKLGFFTLADMQRIESKAFIRTDDNKDGLLTLSEYNYGIPDERQDVIDRFTKRFRLADADTNGRVTMEEYMQFCVNVVAAADANQDGMVTKEEFVAATASGSAE